jgi:lipopolysaccharide export system permease protein
MIIFRYCAKEVYSILAATAIFLLLIFMSTQFVSFIHRAADGDVSTHAVMIILALKTPLLLGISLPLSLFLGILLAYGRMYTDNEMTIFFACGVSKLRLIRMTYRYAIPVAIVTAILTFWIAPYANQYANNLWSKGALSPLELIMPGHFQSLQGGRIIFYVENISRDHTQLTNIFVAEQQPETSDPLQTKQSVAVAASGYQKIDPLTGDTYLVFRNGNRYSGIPGKNDYDITNFSEYGLRINQTDEKIQQRNNGTPTTELWSKRNDPKVAAELSWRIAAPIQAIILACLAVPLARVKTGRSRYTQLIPAMLLYIVYGNFIFVTRDWISSGAINFWVGVFSIHIVMAIIAVLLIMHQAGWRNIARRINLL